MIKLTPKNINLLPEVYGHQQRFNVKIGKYEFRLEAVGRWDQSGGFIIKSIKKLS